MFYNLLFGGLAFTFCSLFYNVALIFIYFRKKHYGILENRIYSSLIITNFIGIILHILCGLTPMQNYSIISVIMCKIYLLYLIIWIALITYYVFIISLNTNERRIEFKHNKRMIMLITTLTSIVSCIICFMLPIDIHNNSSLEVYISGTGVNFVYLFSALMIFIIIICMIRNIKNVLSKTYIPIFTFIAVSGVVIVIQARNPSLLLMTALETYITVMMYFTIENPDMKIIDEFTKSKDISTKNNEQKEVFLTELSQKTRLPLSNINAACNKINQLTNDKKVLQKIEYINNQNKIISYISNVVLSFENVNEKDIPKYENKYNIRKIADELCKKYTKNIDKNKIDLRIEIEKNIPEYLYGDCEKLKKIISIIISKSVEITKDGYLEIGFHEIVKDNICRLLIRTECTSNDISQEEFNNITINHMSSETNKDLINAKELTDSLGGILFGVNAENVIQFSLILNQFVVENNNETIKKIEQYSEYVSYPNVLVVSENSDYLTDIVNRLSKHSLNVEGTPLAAKCIEKVRNNKEYNYILLDENLDLLGVNETLKKLREIPGFKSEVFVLTSNLKNKKYIKNGFDGELSRKINSREISILENRNK